MKKKVIAALTVVFALCLALTVYAFNQSSEVSVKTSASCCTKKDSCPMKDKQKSAEKSSCCDKSDCCGKGDSCPMKTNGEKPEGKKCCSKDGDSCPMKKDSEKQTVSVKMKTATVVSHGIN